MRRLLDRNAARAMIGAPLAARLFIGMSLEPGNSGCAGWICPLIGFAISLPLLFCLRIAGSKGNISVCGRIRDSVPRLLAYVLYLPLALILCADCAEIVRLTANTANINALNNVPTPFLVLPVAVVIGVMILLGANAAGKCARIWTILLPLPLIIIIAVQMRAYEPAWRTPILGGGVRALIHSGLECAGVISMFSLVCMVSEPEDGEKSLLFHAFIAAISAALLLALFRMLSPVRTNAVLSRASHLKMILSNGRVALILQIVLIFVWYGSVLNIVSVEALTACRIAEILFLKLNSRLASVLFALGIGGFACTQTVESEMFFSLGIYRFPVIGGLMLLILICIFLAERKNDPCEK